MEELQRLLTLPAFPSRRGPRAEPSPADRRKRRALWALLLLVPVPSLGVLAGLVIEHPALGTALWMVAKVWMLALPILWTLRVDGAALTWKPPSRAGVIAGALWGLAVAAVIVAAYAGLGSRWIDPAGMRGLLEPLGLTSKGVYLGAAAYWILGNSLLEEFVYRWFVYGRARTLWGERWAVVASAAAFTVHHAVVLSIYFDWRVTLLACVGIFTGGVIWSMLVKKHKTIWAAYASHAIIDVAVFAVGWVLLFG